MSSRFSPPPRAFPLYYIYNRPFPADVHIFPDGFTVPSTFRHSSLRYSRFYRGFYKKITNLSHKNRIFFAFSQNSDHRFLLDTPTVETLPHPVPITSLLNTFIVQYTQISTRIFYTPAFCTKFSISLFLYHF